MLQTPCACAAQAQDENDGEEASQAQVLDDAAADDAPADEEEQTKQKQWEVVPIEAFFRNGRVKFKYIWLEKEPEP